MVLMLIISLDIYTAGPHHVPVQARGIRVAAEQPGAGAAVVTLRTFLQRGC